MHATLSDLVLEVVSNAIEAGASHIDLSFRQTATRIAVEVRDDGKGMTREQLAQCGDPRLTEPGKHDARPRGFGLAFLRQSVDATGGQFDIASGPGAGTRVRFAFDTRHLDTPPIGDLAGTLLLALAYPGGHELVIRRERPAQAGENWKVSRRALLEALGDLDRAGNLLAARHYLKSLEQERETQ